MTAGAQPADAQPGFRVICIKDSGARALFKVYGADALGQARVDRDALRGFGINAVIEGEPLESDQP